MNNMAISTQKTITGEAPPQIWRVVKESNKTALKFADRHYSRKTPGSHHFMGPGQTLVLLSCDDTALFGWRVQEYRKDEQEGVECNIFRNEGPNLSSKLILEAEKCALEKWPGARRLFTMVDSKKIRKKRDPGRCFRKAGWVQCGISKDRGLIILEKLLPEPQ